MLLLIVTIAKGHLTALERRGSNNTEPTSGDTSESTSELLVRLRNQMNELTNLNADAHVAVLRKELETKEQDSTSQPEAAVANELNCEVFTLERMETTGRVLPEEQYLLPASNTIVGEVMRELLTEMRISRDPSNVTTLKEMKTNTMDTSKCDGRCIEVTQVRDAEYLHELVAR